VAAGCFFVYGKQRPDVLAIARSMVFLGQQKAMKGIRCSVGWDPNAFFAAFVSFCLKLYPGDPPYPAVSLFASTLNDFLARRSLGAGNSAKPFSA
jgi:hypothetical protein